MTRKPSIAYRRWVSRIVIVSSITILLFDTYRGRHFRYCPALEYIHNIAYSVHSRILLDVDAREAANVQLWFLKSLSWKLDLWVLSVKSFQWSAAMSWFGSRITGLTECTTISCAFWVISMFESCGFIACSGSCCWFTLI